MQNYNDANYFPGDTTQSIEAWQDRGQDTVKLGQIKSNFSPLELSNFIIFTNQVFRNISVEAGELLMHSGNK